VDAVGDLADRGHRLKEAVGADAGPAASALAREAGVGVGVGVGVLAGLSAGGGVRRGAEWDAICLAVQG
jgi:hypothetical protein